MSVPQVINWTEVDSSNVAAVGWPKHEPSQKVTFVKFKDGAIYGYLGCSRQRAVAMTRATSVGRYLNNKVKPAFQAFRIA